MGKPAIKLLGSSHDRHLTTEHGPWLCDGQTISHSERVDFLVGLLSQCPGCYGGLKRLAAASPDGSVIADGEDVLRRLVRILILVYGKRDAALTQELRAAARIALERGPLEPSTVARLLLEGARQIAADRPDGGAVLDQARELLDTALDQLVAGGRGELTLRPEQRAEMRALGDAYRAYVHTQLGQLVEARRIFDRLAHRAGSGGGSLRDPEIWATILELRAELVRREGRPHHALHLFEQVCRLLEPVAESPAGEERLCETLLYRGIVLLEIGRKGQARDVLQCARDRLQPPVFPRLERELRFYRGAAELACGDLFRARRHLDSAELDGASLPPRMEGHRLRMLGEIERREVSGKAEERFHEALRIFLAQGLMENAARVLLDLLALAAEREDGDVSLSGYAQTVVEISGSEAACHAVAGELRYCLDQLGSGRKTMADAWRLIEALEAPAGVVH